MSAKKKMTAYGKGGRTTKKKRKKPVKKYDIGGTNSSAVIDVEKNATPRRWFPRREMSYNTVVDKIADGSSGYVTTDKQGNTIFKQPSRRGPGAIFNTVQSVIAPNSNPLFGKKYRVVNSMDNTNVRIIPQSGLSVDDAVTTPADAAKFASDFTPAGMAHQGLRNQSLGGRNMSGRNLRNNSRGKSRGKCR